LQGQPQGGGDGGEPALLGFGEVDGGLQGGPELAVLLAELGVFV
jgi:hypothetical protein